jgi:hypothetical protein
VVKFWKHFFAGFLLDVIYEDLVHIFLMTLLQ